MLAHLARAAKARVLALDYRLAPEIPFPAPVEEVAIPIRKRHGVKLAAWYYSDVGDLKHLKEAKGAVTADPEWSGKYVPRVGGLLVAQNTYLMNTAEFGPVPE